MAQGKNKKTQGKKGAKKRVIDPLTKKEWFELRAPVPFKSESFGFTCANRTQGLKKVEDAVRGRVVEYLQADLSPAGSSSYQWRKVKLIVDEVEGKNARTSFYGLDTTRDDLCYLIRKWRTLIETVVDCKTNDGYIIRIFTIVFTRKERHQKTSYALSSQVKAIRKRITDILTREVAKSNITQILTNFTTEIIHEKVAKEAGKIYPVENVKVRKIKVIQRPKIDAAKLNEMHDPEKRKKAFDKTKARRDRGEQPAAAPTGDVKTDETGTQNLVSA